MSTTWFLFSLLAMFLFVVLTAQTYGLKWGLRWSKIEDVSTAKAFRVVVLLFIANLIAGFGTAIVALSLVPNVPKHFSELLVAGTQFVAPTIVVMLLFKARVVPAFLAQLLPMAAGFVVALVAVFGIRPYVYEGFHVPTNSMAPTILGLHQQAVCPKCSLPGFGSSPDDMREHLQARPILLHMICEKGHMFDTESVLKPPGGGDCIFVNKLQNPRRWDIIAFRLPSDRTEVYVKRLVGLPGEELFIRNGAVWVNGERLETPAEMHDLKYLMNLENAGRGSSADPARPARLGPDEYFVLGDFSAQAFDSRFWTDGAPGHPPYAVPEENIIGVVTHIYWPINRWRTFR